MSCGHGRNWDFEHSECRSGSDGGGARNIWLVLEVFRRSDGFQGQLISLHTRLHELASECCWGFKNSLCAVFSVTIPCWPWESRTMHGVSATCEIRLEPQKNDI